MSIGPTFSHIWANTGLTGSSGTSGLMGTSGTTGSTFSYQKWVPVVDCDDCSTTIKVSDSIKIKKRKGIFSTAEVPICKSCHRDRQLKAINI